MRAQCSPDTQGRKPGAVRSDDPLEVGVPTRITMDRHVLRHVKLQPLDVPEQSTVKNADSGGGGFSGRRGMFGERGEDQAQ
jgi:hypothetical protein